MPHPCDITFCGLHFSRCDSCAEALVKVCQTLEIAHTDCFEKVVQNLPRYFTKGEKPNRSSKMVKINKSGISLDKQGDANRMFDIMEGVLGLFGYSLWKYEIENETGKRFEIWISSVLSESMVPKHD